MIKVFPLSFTHHDCSIDLEIYGDDEAEIEFCVDDECEGACTDPNMHAEPGDLDSALESTPLVQ